MKLPIEGWQLTTWFATDVLVPVITCWIFEFESIHVACQFYIILICLLSSRISANLRMTAIIFILLTLFFVSARAYVKCVSAANWSVATRSPAFAVACKADILVSFSVSCAGVHATSIVR